MNREGVKMVCSTCGSDDVSRDAWAEWNEETQRWDLRTEFDEAYCHNCEGETSIGEQPLDRPLEFASHPDFHSHAMFSLLEEIAGLDRDDDGDVLFCADENRVNHLHDKIQALVGKIKGAPNA